MNYKENFEDDGFFYTLVIEPTTAQEERIFVSSQGNGYRCEWEINSKNSTTINNLAVTDDNCELIIYPTVEAARTAAKHFISLTFH